MPERRPQKSAGGVGSPPRGARPYRFQNLEKVTRSQALLIQRLEWLIPSADGSVVDSIRARMKELFEEEVTLFLDYVNLVRPEQLEKIVGEPTFLAILAPAPHKARGFLEIELGLAHAAIDRLLGGAGDTVGHRQLTDIEEGVMSFIVLEALKTLAPNLDAGLPRMRLDGIAKGVENAISILGDEAQVMAVQFKATLGSQAGFVRMFLPVTVVGMTTPPTGGPERRARRASEFNRFAGRLSTIKTWMRAEIGRAEILGRDLAMLRTGDVVLVDEITARPDQNQGGTARLKIGKGRAGWAEADVVVEGERFKLTVKSFIAGEEPKQPAEMSNPLPPGALPNSGSAPPAEVPSMGENRRLADDLPADEVTNPQGELSGRESQNVTENAEGVDLLNDIPLQLSVELGRVSVTAEEVVALKVGQLIDLNRMPGEPVELSVSGKVVARGELVEIDGHLGVRILSLLA